MNARALFILFAMFMVLYPTTVAQVAKAYAEPGETVTVSKFTVDGQSYWFVYIDGEETFIVDSNKDIIRNQTRLRQVLADYSREAFNYEEKSNELRDAYNNFVSSMYPEKAKCEQYTGVDRMECYDKESCLVSCRSVPYCGRQVREDLINGLIKWNADRNSIDSEISSINESLSSLPEDATFYSKMSSKISSLVSDLKSWQKSYLYTTQFCDPMNINYSEADHVKSLLDDFYTFYGGMSAVYSRADLIFRRGENRIQYIETREERYNSLYSNLTKTLSELQSIYLKANFTSSDYSKQLSYSNKVLQNVSSFRSMGKYKEALALGESLQSNLSKLRNDIKLMNIQASLVKKRAREIENEINDAEPLVSGTNLTADLNLQKARLKPYLSSKIDATKLSSASSVLDDISSKVKSIAGEAVLLKQNSATEPNSSAVSGSFLQRLMCAINAFVVNLLGSDLGLCG